MDSMVEIKKIRILIIDDHYFIRAGLTDCLHLEPDMQVVAEASNGPKAIEEYRKVQPDIMLVDLVLPGMDGVEVITAVRQEFPKARTIILSAHDGEEDIYRAFQAGANGYLLKSMEPETLAEAIRKVHSGRNHVPPIIAERLTLRMPRLEFSTREKDVLHQIAKGLSNRDIGLALNIKEGTVKLHVHKVLEKMKVTDRTQAATAALRNGIVRLG
jgi:two-component system NarL family response regulator